MKNLLCAYFSRLWKEKMFWAAVIFMAAAGFFFTALHYCTHPESNYTPEEFCFNFHQLIGVVSAIVCCLFWAGNFRTAPCATSSSPDIPALLCIWPDWS